MSVEQRLSSTPTNPAAPTIEPATARPTGPTADEGLSVPSSPASPPHTRLSATWFGVCAAALTLVVLIIFMLQNTRSVEVSFLWLHGDVPLALALLIASVGTAIAVMVVGAARITQLRRHTRRVH
ncbi:LapA family protein [Allorhizocola rhizosphaerae]|uniref:LapA family protein n=1 Tax=Allorhizocola rhizosphaerae TaxID=1872709 RepID=UPI0013C319AA|nr:lipopolysaccharide assembly protein LapA domain-containing protein [Allorhizocola rhizosphaerae]